MSYCFSIKKHITELRGDGVDDDWSHSNYLPSFWCQLARRQWGSWYVLFIRFFFTSIVEPFVSFWCRGRSQMCREKDTSFDVILDVTFFRLENHQSDHFGSSSDGHGEKLLSRIVVDLFRSFLLLWLDAASVARIHRKTHSFLMSHFFF